MTTIYAERQESQRLNAEYRAAAAKKYDVRVPFDAVVSPVEDGAFVEVLVWVSRAEALAEGNR
jgi:hypothetical protein